MSRHMIQLPSSTAAGRAVVTVGYTSGVRGPHFFCSLSDATPPITTQLWNSLFSLEHMRAQNVDDFDTILSQWSVSLPPFIKRALQEDWAKNLKGPVEYCWQEDGTFDQVA